MDIQLPLPKESNLSGFQFQNSPGEIKIIIERKKKLNGYKNAIFKY